MDGVTEPCIAECASLNDAVKLIIMSLETFYQTPSKDAELLNIGFLIIFFKNTGMSVNMFFCKYATTKHVTSVLSHLRRP